MGMPRIARMVVPDVPYHVTQRGNRREDVFFSDRDRFVYLEFLQKYTQQHGVDVVAYCLMTNHVHLVVVPRTEQALAGALKPLHLRYAQHVNWTQGLTGRLWQGRFFSCGLDVAHLFSAVRYVERNPVRAGMVDRAEAYPWSSAAAHCGLVSAPWLADASAIAAEAGDWAAWLCAEEDETTVTALRRHTSTGRPLGSVTFLERMESLLGRAVRPRKAGRPRKVVEEA